MPLPLVVRIEASDARSADALLQDGWRPVEVLETWSRPIGEWKRIVSAVRTATPLDLLPCQHIAAGAFRYDRMHRDPLVPADDADEFKRQWICRAFESSIENVFVHLDPRDHVNGFLICKVDSRVVMVDLIAVAANSRRQGVAGRLVGWAHDYYPGRTEMFAGTQEDNDDARMTYQKLGFHIILRRRTFHK